MKILLQAAKERLLASGGTVSAGLGALGSSYNVCHSVCMAIVSVLAVIGITLNVLPLMFLQTYQHYFWWAAFLMTMGALYIYLMQKKQRLRDRNLLLLNAGFLMYGLPYKQLADYTDFFRFVGVSVVLSAVFLLFFAKRFRTVYRPADEVEQATAHHKYQPKPRLSLQTALGVLIIGSFTMNQYLIYRNGLLSWPALATIAGQEQTAFRMKFSPFDVALAKKRMDKDKDGACDECGMSIEQCIENGQLDCTMGAKRADAIGVLGTQHIHADWKIYVDGQPFDWKPYVDLHARQMQGDTSITNTSAFMHMHPAPAPEEPGDVLHMHATNVPLWLFFRSVGMQLGPGSLTLADGRVLKNEEAKTLKFYVNGKRAERLDTYVFNDLDKLLVSYGPADDPDIPRQLDSITSFAQKH